MFGCRLAKDPAPRPSPSIEASKKDTVFIDEYQPELPYLRIEGKNYKIKEAWIEHPHLERNEGHIPLKKDYVFVMTFDPRQYLTDSIDFRMYTRDLASGNWDIWFFLHGDAKKNIKDTITLYYRETLITKEQKKFLLFKKNSMP